MSACIDIAKYEYLQGYYSLYQTQGCAYTLKLYSINVFDEYVILPTLSRDLSGCGPAQVCLRSQP